MDKRSLEELLNAYGLPGVEEEGAPADLAGLTPEARAELESLAQFTLLLRQNLAPASLRLAFREDLRQSLISTALQRHGWRGMILVQLREHWKITAAAAATASGVSVAVGAIGMAVWYRGRSQP
ncbi:MAG: hypothetical protein V9H69_13315 [Anaerolineae bacterium]